MFQDCLTKLWIGTLEYFGNQECDVNIPYKLFCNNICETILNDYIQMIQNDKKILEYDKYYSEDKKINFLDKHIIR